MSPTPACTVSVPQDAPLSGKDLHSVPCKIDYTGQANVSGYFIHSHAENGTLSAAFRGRGLQGCQLALPADYQLFVVKEKLNSAGGTRRFTVLDSRNNFTQWEWDREAGPNSAPARVFTSLRVANAMAED